MKSEYIKTDAVILDHEDLRTSSLKLHVHTAEEGRVFLHAKGFYKNKNQQNTILSPGTVLEIVYLIPKKNEMPLIKEMESITVPRIRGAVQLTMVHHFVEFLKNIQTTSKREHVSLYKLFSNLIDSIEDPSRSSHETAGALLIHEMTALHILGFLPDIAACSSCSAAADKNISFSLKENGFACKKCAQGKEAIALDEDLKEIFQNLTSEKITPRKLRKITKTHSLSLQSTKKLHLIFQSILEDISNIHLKSDRFLKKILQER